MRPPIFWTLLAAFALVIVLGICGMLGFVGLALSGVWQTGPLREVYTSTEHFYGEALGDYYVANGRSWQGIEERVNELPFGGSEFVILDRQNRVVVGDQNADLASASRRPNNQEPGIPIVWGEQELGTLVFLRGGRAEFATAPRAVALSIIRSFLLAGGGLAMLLLLLAVLLSRWLARPLRNVTDAALLVAGGQLDVRVAGARIRELDNLSHAFNTMAFALNNADRQRRQLTADIAHELRTPLTIVKGRLEGIQDGVYQPTPTQIGQLLDETALLERLIDDLRILALAEAGQLPLYLEPVDPGELLHDCAALFAAQAAEHGIALRIDVAANLPHVDVDAQRMQQVLSNVVANALRHTPADGEVRFSASRSVPTAIFLVIADTGSGIPPEDLPHVFDRFYRADRSRTRTGGGSGLGLAIARQIVLAHGGQIDATSTPGRGTTITITLPAIAMESEL